MASAEVDRRRKRFQRWLAVLALPVFLGTMVLDLWDLIYERTAMALLVTANVTLVLIVVLATWLFPERLGD